jgi:hypothetical protein
VDNIDDQFWRASRIWLNNIPTTLVCEWHQTWLGGSEKSGDECLACYQTGVHDATRTSEESYVHRQHRDIVDNAAFGILILA